ncbi:MAG TPA: carboxypeptidase-like regulatory domain-containing protein [Flavobacteriales bacterium]|nr:carboxypeptidase-like regulatory domain-containing protein [Flavobacteriales bacterium]
MRPYVLALCLLAMLPLAAQQTIEARIIDAASSEPLPYAAITLHGHTRGTISNADGRFRVPLGMPSDSLRIAYIGYSTKLIPLTADLNATDIRLQPTTYVLGEAVVRPGEDLYERFVAASNWLRRAPEVSAKLYFSLDTYSEEVPVEAMEGYFNAVLKSATLRQMNFKQGVIGIVPKDGRHYINYNTGSALVCLDIHGDQPYFPNSPFSHTAARELKKHYSVERISIGSGPDGVEQLAALPRDSVAGAFSATLWLVPGCDIVRAMELRCIDCPKHPLIPLFDHGRIDTVDLRYKQTWSTTGPAMPEVIQVDYGVAYTGPDFHERYTTSAVLHAFDRGQPFLPTLFPWKNGVNEYPMIAWMPRDTAFWDRMLPPVPTERQQRDRAFVLRNDVTRNAWFDSLRLDHRHLRPHYLAWSKDRLIDSTHLSGVPIDRPNDGKQPPSVQIRTHLYLDLDTTGGVLHHRTLAVLDARSSWYLYPWEPWASAYCTLLLDLCEIERRALEQRLNEPGMTHARAQQLHKEHTQRMKDEQKKLLMSVESYVIQLRSWNARVRELLGVDRYRDANVGAPP